MRDQRGFATLIVIFVIVAVTVSIALIHGSGPTEQARNAPVGLTLAAGLAESASAQWSSTTDFGAKVIYVVVRSEDLAQQALEQFVMDKSCTGTSAWGYEIYMQRQDKKDQELWVTDEKPRHAGKIKLCKGK